MFDWLGDVFDSASSVAGDVASAATTAMDALPSNLYSLFDEVPRLGGQIASAVVPAATEAASSGGQGALGQVGGWLGRLWEGDPRTARQAQMGLGALGLLGSYRQSRRRKAQPTVSEMQQMLKGKYNDWSPSQREAFDKYFYSPVPQFRPVAPSLPTQRMAHGGALRMMCGGGTPQHGRNEVRMASGGMLSGPGGGQDDIIDIKAAPGEYVFDADVVSALGDGSNEQGARLLDEFRERIRTHKRSAPADEIPPRSKPIESYLKG